MSIPDYNTTPTNGYLDSTTFPNPTSQGQRRTQANNIPMQILGFLNDLKNKLLSTVAGSSGAEQIGSATITGVAGNTPHAQITDLKSQLSGVVLGQIPDGSLTETKMANDMKKQAGGVASFDTVATHTANNVHKVSKIYSYKNIGGAL